MALAVYGGVDVGGYTGLPMSTTIRVSDGTRRKLRALSEATGQPLTAVVDLAVEALRRERFFDEMDAAYAVLREADVWEEVSAERSAWDATLGDGLETSS